MKDVFRFWGYGRDVWEALAGPGRLVAEEGDPGRPLETAFGRLRFSGRGLALLADFAEETGDGLLAYVQHRGRGQPEGEVVAWLEGPDLGAGLPLVSVDGAACFRFHFDVDRSIDHVQQERYFATKAPLYVKLGLSPETLPAGLRKAVLMAFHLSRAIHLKVRPPARFPRLYKDFSVDVWRFLVRAIIKAGAETAPKGVDLWPDGKAYAVVLNHDVDSAWGIDNPQGIAAFRAIEESVGLRSAWMVVAGLHEAGRACFHSLLEGGHEIGCHGVEHDHVTAYLPVAEIVERLAAAAPFLEEFACTGFRAPSYHRSENLYRALDSVVAYDMSMHDSFENANSPVPSFEGCATCFPFRIAGTGVLQIPTTVAEDFVLELAGQAPQEARRTQAAIVAAIRRRRGVANILTHPEPHLSARAPWIDCYRGLLEDLKGDASAWFALPRQVCDWWNRRAAEIEARW